MPLRKQMTVAVIESLWQSASIATRLPTLVPTASALDAALGKAFNSHRSADRIPYDEHGVIFYNGDLYGIITKDLSRTGIGIYSPLPIQIGHKAGLMLPDLRVRTIEVVRCSAIAVRCYEIGAGFRDAIESANQ